MVADPDPRPTSAGRPEPGGAFRAPASTPVVPAAKTGNLRAADRAGMSRRQRLRELLRAPPALILAVGLHVGFAALYLWLNPPGILQPEPPARTVRAELDEAPPEVAQLEAEPPPEPEEPPPPSADFETDVPVDEPDDPLTVPAQAPVLGFGGAGVRSSGGGGGGGASRGSGLDPTSVVEANDPFARFVSDLRERGLDVVFVVDATGSMQRFIDRARAVIDDIATDLSAIVPNLRLGLVAYRDLGDDWITRQSELDENRYQLANFLLDLRASGGKRVSADLEEAVEEGLRVAVEELAWRPGARRVLLIVGDAPYHEEDRSKALGYVRSFSREPQSVVNTMLVRTSAGDLTRNEQAASEAFGRIVQAGGGAAFELIASDSSSESTLRQQVLEASFGRAWKAQIDALLATRGPDSRSRSVRRQVERGNRAWFLKRLADERVHPLVVEGLVELLDRATGHKLLEQLVDPAGDALHRSIALHVLKRARPELRGVEVDVTVPLDTTSAVHSRLRSSIAELPLAPAGRAAPPPRPPRPSGSGTR